MSIFFGHRTFHKDEVARKFDDVLPKTYDSMFSRMFIPLNLPGIFGQFPYLSSFQSGMTAIMLSVNTTLNEETQWFLDHEYPNRRGPKYYNIPDHDKVMTWRRWETRMDRNRFRFEVE